MGSIIGFVAAGLIVLSLLALVAMAVAAVVTAVLTVRADRADQVLREDLDEVLDEILGVTPSRVHRR
jgi:hypothetical protein